MIQEANSAESTVGRGHRWTVEVSGSNDEAMVLGGPNSQRRRRRTKFNGFRGKPSKKLLKLKLHVALPCYSIRTTNKYFFFGCCSKVF